MSTLEKAVMLMKTMPERKIETIYAFIRFMDTEPEEMTTRSSQKKELRYNQ